MILYVIGPCTPQAVEIRREVTPDNILFYVSRWLCDENTTGKQETQTEDIMNMMK